MRNKERVRLDPNAEDDQYWMWLFEIEKNATNLSDWETGFIDNLIEEEKNIEVLSESRKTSIRKIYREKM